MIKIIDLVKVYTPKKGVSVTALNNINLELPSKGMVFLLGKSGSGKSTLLNLIGGLDCATSGDIVIKGKSTKDFDQSNFDSFRNALVGFVFQECNILEEYTVGKNIGLALELQNKPYDKVAIESILDIVDLNGYYDRKPNELSGGQNQRIAIARAIIKNPSIILADEPTGALDTVTGKQVFETLKKLSLDKLVIVVSHDREDAEIYGDRIIELADGNIISDRVRSENTGEIVEKSVLAVDEKLVRIKAGSKLTKDELNILVDTIEKSGDDAYFSFDGKSNKDFANKSTALNIGSASFTDTTADKIDIKEYASDELQLTKSKLPAKYSFKMGASNLTHKKIRLTVSIILCIITFTMVGFCVAASFFDGMKVELQTIYDSDLQYVVLNRIKIEENGGEVHTNTMDGFSKEELAKYEQLTGKRPLKIYGDEFQFFSLTNNLKTKFDYFDNTSPLYYIKNISNFVILNSENDLELTAIGESKLPKLRNEIAITDYIADTFIEYGYSYGSEGNEITEVITDAAQMIGKKVIGKEGGEDYVITGVYKTSMDKTKFEQYKNVKANSLIGAVFSGRDTLMGCMFVSPEFVYSGNSNGSGNSIEYGIGNIYYNDKKINTFHSLNDYNSAETTEFIKGFDKTAPLDDNQILIPKSYLDKIAGENEVITVKQFLNREKEDRMLDIQYIGDKLESFPMEVVGIMDNVEDRGAAICFSANFIKQYLNLDKTSAKNRIELPYEAGGYLFAKKGDESLGGQAMYAQRLAIYNNNPDKSTIYWGKTGGVENTPKTTLADNEIIIPINMFKFNNDKINYEDIKKQFDEWSEKEVRLHDAKNRFEPNFEQTLIDENGKKFTVVGIGLDLYSEIICSDNVFNEFNIAKSPLSVLVAVPDTAEKRAEFETLLRTKTEKDAKGECEKAELSSHISQIVSYGNFISKDIAIIMLVAAIILSIFSALLMMNFITTSISYKKKEIGILRAIGARSTDIFKIFFAESFIISLIIITISSIALSIIAVLMNKMITISVVILNPLAYLSIAGLCLFVAFLSTIIPTSKIARKKPIDSIQNK